VLIICGLWLIFVAYVFGRKERKRLNWVNTQDETTSITIDVIKTMGQDLRLLRPKLKWVNLLLLIAAMVVLVKGWIPAAPLFIAAFAVAILINYRNFDLMEERMRAHAGNALWTATMVFGAGIFTGVLQGTKMIDAIAHSLVSLIPETLGAHIPMISGLFSYLSTLVISPDAFYFGMLPIISKAAAFYGIDPAVTGRAALFGQIGYGISPLVAAPLLLCSMAKVQFFDHQRFTFIWGLLTTIVMLVAAVLTDCIPL
jgi:citrate transporter, CitMHS family